LDAGATGRALAARGRGPFPPSQGRQGTHQVIPTGFTLRIGRDPAEGFGLDGPARGGIGRLPATLPNQRLEVRRREAGRAQQGHAQLDLIHSACFHAVTF
jgi:hypothetical protein